SQVARHGLAGGLVEADEGGLVDVLGGQGVEVDVDDLIAEVEHLTGERRRLLVLVGARLRGGGRPRGGRGGGGAGRQQSDADQDRSHDWPPSGRKRTNHRVTETRQAEEEGSSLLCLSSSVSSVTLWLGFFLSARTTTASAPGVRAARSSASCR